MVKPKMIDIYDYLFGEKWMTGFLIMDWAYMLYYTFSGCKQEQKKEPSKLEQMTEKYVKEDYKK